MSKRASMTMADLEAIHEYEHEREQAVSVVPAQEPHLEPQVNADPKYLEHSSVFREICEDIEHEETLLPSRSQRKASFTTDDLEKEEQNLANSRNSSRKKPRRHSSYESRCRTEHRRHHTEVKEYLAMLGDEQSQRRLEFVNSLLKFNLSMEMSMSSFSDLGDVSSPAMAMSCPVLSYMNDDEEDSIELAHFKHPSFTTPTVPEEESWESLKTDPEEEPKDAHEESREYFIQLQDSDQGENYDKMASQKKLHSYKMLELRLKQESPLQVIKSFNESLNNSFSLGEAVARAPAGSIFKILGDDSMSMPQLGSPAPQPPPMKQQTLGVARGA
jgi:hypothetical protein